MRRVIMHLGDLAVQEYRFTGSIGSIVLYIHVLVPLNRNPDRFQTLNMNQSIRKPTDDAFVISVECVLD
jgi:hypothetical protein